MFFVADSPRFRLYHDRRLSMSLLAMFRSSIGSFPTRALISPRSQAFVGSGRVLVGCGDAVVVGGGAFLPCVATVCACSKIYMGAINQVEKFSNCFYILVLSNSVKRIFCSF